MLLWYECGSDMCVNVVVLSMVSVLGVLKVVLSGLMCMMGGCFG